MTKIAIFGGTGMTGQCVVRYALEKGLSVRVLVRSETTIPDDFKDKIEVIKGDVLNIEDVEKAVNGSDLIVSVLGTRNSLEPTTMMSTGTKNIIAAMNKHNLKKASFCMSSFLFWDETKVPKQFAELNADHRRMLEIIKASDIEYRAILPPHIANEPSGKFETAYDKHPGDSRSISKYDLAKFFVESLENDDHARKVIGLASIKP